MTIYCPKCGMPVDVNPKFSTIHINSKGNLVVVIPDVVARHECRKSDEPPPMYQDRPL